MKIKLSQLKNCSPLTKFKWGRVKKKKEWQIANTITQGSRNNIYDTYYLLKIHHWICYTN